MPDGGLADLVIIGGGMAAERLLCQLGDRGYPGKALLISDEAEAGYNRVLLPDLLAGNSTWSDMERRSSSGSRGAWYEMRLGTRVVEIDTQAKQLIDANGSTHHWGSLVFATGSSAAIPDALRVDCEGIQALRTIADVNMIKERQQRDQTVAVIGGGLLGLEAAHALRLCGFRVVVIHRSSKLMNRQLDTESSAMLLEVLERKGLEFRLGCEVTAVITSQSTVRSLRLSDGSTLEIDRVVVASGNVANTSVAADSGVVCRTGIVVDSKLQTSAPNVFAIGECAEYSGATRCFVEPVYAQADALAKQLCGEPGSLDLPAASARLKVAGVELFCAGDTAEREFIDTTARAAAVIRDPQSGVYRCLNFVGDVLRGAILLGDTHGSRSIFDCIGARVDSALAREQLLFGTATSHA